MVWMNQGVSIIGPQMDLIFVYIVEQTLTKTQHNLLETIKNNKVTI